MSKILKVLKETRDVLMTAAAVLAAAIVVVETYEALSKKVNAAKDAYLTGDSR
jgi:hypothetical protein